MKIYRAVLRYNNADTCEWERWYTRASVWYGIRNLAEIHLEELNRYLEHLKTNVFANYIDEFKYKNPFIEVAEIHDEVVPMDIKFDNEFYDI